MRLRSRNYRHIQYFAFHHTLFRIHFKSGRKYLRPDQNSSLCVTSGRNAISNEHCPASTKHAYHREVKDYRNAADNCKHETASQSQSIIMQRGKTKFQQRATLRLAETKTPPRLADNSAWASARDGSTPPFTTFNVKLAQRFVCPLARLREREKGMAGFIIRGGIFAMTVSRAPIFWKFSVFNLTNLNNAEPLKA